MKQSHDGIYEHDETLYCFSHICAYGVTKLLKNDNIINDGYMMKNDLEN